VRKKEKEEFSEWDQTCGGRFVRALWGKAGTRSGWTWRERRSQNGERRGWFLKSSIGTYKMEHKYTDK